MNAPLRQYRLAFFRTPRLVLACAVLLIGALAGPVTAAASAGAAPAPRTATSVPHYQHIAVIMDLDHDYGSILNNKYAPNINRLAKQYGLASHYYTVADPDIADEVALLGGSPFGVNDNFPYWGEQIHEPSLLSQLDAAGLTWKAYVQSLPYPGYLGDCYPTECLGTPQVDTLYKQIKFNGVPDFASVADNPSEARKMVPATELGADASAGKLPNFSLILPDECHDMHGGPPWCVDGSNAYHQPNDNRLVAAGDSYVGQVVHEIMSGPQWTRGNNAIVVTFTEGDTNAGCCGTVPGTGRVMTVVITSHGPRHLTDPAPYNHYSLLSTIQHAFGLSCLQESCDTAHVVPMVRLFGGARDPRPGRSGTAARQARRTPAPPRAAAVASPWKLVPSPDIGTNDNNVGAIAASSPSDIWAVGALLPTASSTRTHTLAIHYNGTAWSDVATPDVGRQANILLGVAAQPNGTAFAVGNYTRPAGHTSRTLAELWNGHRWAVVPSASPSGLEDMLYSATASSTAGVWAVGAYEAKDGLFRNLIERWTGTRWVAVPSPDPGAAGDFLYSVTSGASGVWASGQELSGQAPDKQVILHLSQGSWHVVAEPAVTSAGAPASAYPQFIAASPDGLWVAGNDRPGHSGFHTLVEAPRGGGRVAELATPDPTPQDNYLWGIAPVGTGHSAWAVGNSVQAKTGNYLSLIEYGTASGGWHIVPSPSPGLKNNGNTIIGAALAFSPDNVWAVGMFDGNGGHRTMVLHYTGSR